ncbi:sulfatase [Niabella beijingensis]|uniref:sulfatase n=1 Tax=Niabella beijingensis TaxID=2872700 RepID=UPI001CBB5832|nr:sulfatase [Niabella beijingensis]MBZ4191990.1 sulfatase [Niabella beijingensis]
MKQRCFLLLFFVFSLSASAQQRPNIIVFLVDDMGWQDCSLPFWKERTPLNKRYHTPNMERLAAEGMQFTNAYAAPVCTPSRTAMLTGMNPAHLRITNWTSPAKNNNTDAPDDQFAPADWNINGLSPVPGIERTAYATPFPGLLKEAGYYTIHVGKAHWGSVGTPGASPYNMGFMVNIAGHAAGHPQSYWASENYGNFPRQQPKAQAVPDLEQYFGTDTFLTEALTLEALKALETPIERKQPFYLNMAHYAVHTPIMADPRFIKKYLDAGIDSTEAAYATLVEGMDKSLGDIMDYLKHKGVDGNTVIIFMSDNGGLSLAGARGGKAHTQNLPLRAGKGSVYEGGIREPMIVKYPGVVKPGTIAEQYVIIEDFFPTILELAGIKNYKLIQQLDGRSFVPLLKNPALKDATRDLVWHYPNKWQNAGGPGINYFSAVRKGDWKLVYSLRTGKAELYNLKEDIGETNDLAAQQPATTRELQSLLGRRLKDWNAPMPVDKKTNRPVAVP